MQLILVQNALAILNRGKLTFVGILKEMSQKEIRFKLIFFNDLFLFASLEERFKAIYKGMERIAEVLGRGHSRLKEEHP